MSGATRGVYFERVVQDMLQDAGYFVVRSAGSHGVADLVAIKLQGLDTSVILCQCKVSLSLLGSREWNELWDTCQAIGAAAIVAHRPTPRKTAFHELVCPREFNARASTLMREWTP